jgi:hypothetical protein
VAAAWGDFVAMTERTLPGPHNCTGMARFSIDHVFRVLDANCTAADGVLTIAQLRRAHADIIGGLAGGFDIIEMAHKHCMEASHSNAPDLFSPNAILGTVLCAAFGETVKDVFYFQVATHGPRWLRGFFDCFAKFVTTNTCPTSVEELTSAYREAAIKFGAAMTIEELLSEHSIRHIIHFCIRPLVIANAIEEAAEGLAKAIRIEIDGHIYSINKTSAFRFLEQHSNISLMKRRHEPSPALSKAEIESRRNDCLPSVKAGIQPG